MCGTVNMQHFVRESLQLYMVNVQHSAVCYTDFSLKQEELKKTKVFVFAPRHI